MTVHRIGFVKLKLAEESMGKWDPLRSRGNYMHFILSSLSVLIFVYYSLVLVRSLKESLLYLVLLMLVVT
jgi:hypothetical protein